MDFPPFMMVYHKQLKSPISVEPRHAERIALLLKHDWERVKLEAGPFVMKVKRVRRWIGAILYKPDREKYEQKR
jgi:hypothetical protein